jgi:DNA-binding response OmpR family regulator
MARVLLLNDHSTMLNALAAILEVGGHESLTARTNDEAISLLCAQPIDLLIQDIGRPGMNGWQFCQLMKADSRMRNVPILITSGYPSPTDPEKLALISGYITLPFDMEEFLATVERVLSKKSYVAVQ